MKNVKAFILLLAVSLVGLTTTALAQQDYTLREQRAPAVEKQRLAELRKRIQLKKLTFKVGYTYAREVGVSKLTGGKRINVSAAQARRQNDLSEKLVRIDDDARKLSKVSPIQRSCSASLQKWDWRKQGKVTPVKQQKCGNCWAYAALGAYEGSYLIRNSISVDGSEQYIVSNNDNGAGSCDGGWAHLAIEFLVNTGTTSEAIMPDIGLTGTPDPSIATPYDGVAWGWANPDNAGNPGVQKIKEALCTYGPVATWIDAGGSFGDYTTGVYNDDDDKEPGHWVGGHFVTIIGWDQSKGAWIIKNSWGQDWGETAGFGTERGYGFITYGTHSVGADVSWIRAESNVYRLPLKYYELIPLKKRFPEPDPLPKLVIKNPVIKKP